MSDLPVFDCTGAVLGTPWSWLEVAAYHGTDEQGRHRWRLICLRCGWGLTRTHQQVMNHHVWKGKATNYCGPCRFEAEQLGVLPDLPANPYINNPN